MGKYILAIDQGTTSSRCIIFDKQGNTISCASKEFTQYFPANGFYSGIEEIRENRSSHQIFSPGISNEVRNRLINGWKDAVSRVLM